MRLAKASAALVVVAISLVSHVAEKINLVNVGFNATKHDMRAALAEFANARERYNS